MQDRPSYQELLEAVRHFLETDAVPALEGAKKFHARVAANVLAIVSRELALESRHLAGEWQRLDRLLGAASVPADPTALKDALRERTHTLCDRIRRGDADDGAFRTAVLDHVRRTVLDKLAIDNPKLVPTPSGSDRP